MQDETMVKDIIDSYKSDLEKVEKYFDISRRRLEETINNLC